MLATSFNSLAAQLVGVHTGRVLFLSFAMSGALGALGGVLVTPITLTSYDVGIMLGLKGFVAAGQLPEILMHHRLRVDELSSLATRCDLVARQGRRRAGI